MSKASLYQLKAQMRVAVQHQRLFDRGIWEPEAHDSHAFGFRHDAVRTIDCFFGSTDPLSLLHSSVSMKLPGSVISTLPLVAEYMAETARIRSTFDIKISAPSNLIFVARNRV